MIRRFVVLLLALACLVGCAAPMTFRFDEGTTPAEKSATEEAFARWNEHVKASKRLTVDDRGAWLVSFVDRIPTKDGDMAGRECTHAGEDCARSRWVRIVRTLAPPILVRVITHETGHALGIPHTKGPPSIMYRAVEPFEGPMITPIDVAACRDVGSCP